MCYRVAVAHFSISSCLCTSTNPMPSAQSHRRRVAIAVPAGKPRQFPLFVEAALVLHSITRHTTSTTCFPKLYTIPREAPWPRHLQGVKLNTAQVRMHYKNGNLHPETLAALESINFVFDVNEVKWAQKIAALHIYKSLHGGDLCVPQDFRIPSNDARWPRDVWGMRLGLAVRSIRQKTRPDSPRHAQLSAMGFVWNVLDMGWETKRLALRAYKHVFGDLLVAYSFTVPSDDAAWPKETWGLKLGHAVHNIRQNGHDMSAERHAQLQDLGFVWDHLESSWDVKVTALRAFARMHGHVVVPYGFVVPSNSTDSERWPRETWGLKLGHAVHNMRQNMDEMPACRRALLNDMGFAWHSTPLTWDTKLRALQIFAARASHLNIPADFRIPEDPAWPKKTWHVRLADVTDELRRHAHKLHAGQVAALDALGFSWSCMGEAAAREDDGGRCAATCGNDSDDTMDVVSICDGFPLVKRRRWVSSPPPLNATAALLVAL
ncbi:Aste57867_18651 [Aphanomyces stellatus]|uniref:Aste57867_18651 protein n=1 Tax=Aphanomyces stellatus TaxID=120398 RepID=A0A485LAX0_9STRA|nr:hypothetical protein As57867_018589 [Aphanomyces stellatus]VFT95386.1 Aste57867_18651 [Aphanomyces stellatus]